MTNTFEHSRKALVVYDAGEGERQRLYNAVVDNETLALWQAQVLKDITALQDAFYEDTKSVNNRDHCKYVDVAFIRKLVRSSGAS